MSPTKKKNLLVTYVLQNIAYTLLAATPDGHAVKAAAEAHRRKLLELPAEEYGRILQIRDSLIKLAERLAASESIEAIIQVEHLVNELVAGNVVIVDDDSYHALNQAVNDLDNGK